VSDWEGTHFRTSQERVVALLRRAILSGEFPPGTRLTQNQLAERMAASTSPVREAVRQLASEGLLRIAPNTSVTVAIPTADEIEDVYELLLILEPLAMRRAAAQFTRRDAAGPEEVLQQMALVADDVGQWSILNSEFHDRLTVASGSKHLADVLRTLRRIGALYVSASLQAPNRMRESESEHLEILARVCSGDVDAAAELARQHLISTLAALGLAPPEGQSLSHVQELRHQSAVGSAHSGPSS
jgi:DNA-binding GntR family transcriptional regulator